MNKAEASKFLKSVDSFESRQAAADAMGIPRTTLYYKIGKANGVLDGETTVHKNGRYSAARRSPQSRFSREIPRSRDAVRPASSLADVVLSGDETSVQLKAREMENRKLREQNRQLASQVLDDKVVREQILEIAHHKPAVPAWLEARKSKSSDNLPGVPILFASDWHWGEVVNPDEIGGVNKYNMDIARARARVCVERAIMLLTKFMVNPRYPGIVFALGGDMVSGNIHEELSETNEIPTIPVVLELIDNLTQAIRRLKEVFGRVFVPCVAGNHGRTTKKIRAKEFNYNSYDWLIYQSLDRVFADDPDVVFYIPDGSDALFTVCGHRYLLTHGNQFRGGDGMIGPLGPIIRGDHKKRSRNAQVGQEYDTLVIGHFHQLLQTKRVIVNGSLKGYDEYAYAGNFGYEPAQQALWITHPRHGITFSMPVNLDEDENGVKIGAKGAEPWVSFHNAKRVAHA